MSRAVGRLWRYSQRNRWLRVLVLVVGIYLLNRYISGDSRAFDKRLEFARPLKKCYPYHDRGSMLIDYEADYEHTYISHSGFCPAQNNLLSRLATGDTPPQLRGKTILLFGDSIDRGLWEYFGTLPGAKIDAMPGTKEFAASIGHHTMNNRVRFEKDDLTIGFFFFRGLDENRDWDGTKMVEGKDTRWRVLFQNMTHLWVHADPDLVVTQSGVWDLARYQLPRITPSDHAGPSYAGLAGRFVPEWHDSAQDYLTQLSDLFPRATIFWRTVHQPVTPFFWQDAVVDGAHPLRIQQMRQLQLSVVEAMRIPVLPLDLVIDHQADLMKDAFHPGDRGNSVYAELVLAALDSVVSHH